MYDTLLLYPAQLHVRGSTLHIANMYEIYLHCGRHTTHILLHTHAVRRLSVVY